MITSNTTAQPVLSEPLPIDVREVIHELIRLLPDDTTIDVRDSEDGWTVIAHGPTGRELERREVYR